MTLRISRLGMAVALAATLTGGAALAGPAADKAAEAEALLAGGDVAGAIVAFDEAADAFWAALPLGHRAAVFADSVAGFGDYQPRSSATFRNGETATAYVEPVGYGYVSAGGWYRVAFSTALQIRTPGGLVLAESEDFGKLVWAGRAPSREVPLTISVALPDLKPGSYEMVLTLTDDATGESDILTLPFAVAE